MSGVEVALHEALGISRRDLGRARQKIADLEADRTALEKERDALATRASHAEHALSAAFDLPPTITPTPGEAKRWVEEMQRERDTLAHERAGLLETIQHLRARIADLTGETRFVAQRVVWHLSNGCDTAAKARELAMAEWDVAVMGGGA